ncbi:MAG: hypothetical protein HQK67_13275, partial [Desulfamplus sp.]|nr:hypothetical protein [Desulfamplus sp.]
MGTYTGGEAHTYDNTDETNYGVNRNNTELSGFGWSNTTGWINFNPKDGGVTIDAATGAFDGYAWGENIGWIHFKGNAPAYNVKIAAVSPTVTTQAVSNIGENTATGNGNITNLGTTNPTQYGVCWNTSTNPTIANSKTAQEAAAATGAFTSSITGLSSSTTYYVRAYATNTAGTAYGDEVSFTTASPPPPVYTVT